ncbi:glycosyltransferase [Flavitalea antarctica]
MISTHTAAVVVLYNPHEEYLHNIATYVDQVARLFIIDNSEFPDERILKGLSANPKVVIISHKINHGIAKALNIAGRRAIHEGYAWLLTMDQDSSFQPGVLSAYLKAADEHVDKNAVAVFGLAYDKKFLSSFAPGEKYLEVNSLITSGSLVNLQIFQELQGFEEKLFIDEVDHDYCYRAVLSGFKVVVVRTGLMSHSLGESLEVTGSRGSAPRRKIIHSPVRIYYIVRNGLYISRKYKKDFPKESAKRRKIIYVTVKNNLVYGKQKFAVLRYTLLGLWHFLKNRYYKL